jgi:hypothetical protein
VDTLDSWYEAWRQKSFSIRENVNLNEDERWSSSSSLSAPDGEREERPNFETNQSKIDRAKDIIRQGQKS